MQELPEDLLTTDKLLYLNGLDGESQVPLMRKLAQVAQTLYGKYPEFCALVPFGSRTKGLSYTDSDLDIFLILDFKETGIGHPCNQERITEMKRILKTMIRQNKTDTFQIDIFEIGKYEYRALLSGVEYFPEIGGAVFAAVLGATFGPHRLSDVRKEISQLGTQKKREILHRIIAEIKTIEEIGADKKMPDKIIYSQYLPNRLRLWERRIRHLLDYKGDL